MNCQQVDKHIYEYCDASLSPETAPQIEQHLEQCAACNNLAQLTRMENEVLKDALIIDALDDDFTSRVMAAVSARQASLDKDSRQMIKTSRTNKVYLFIAAAAAVVLLITGVVPDFYNTFNIGKENSKFEVAVKGRTNQQVMNGLSSDPAEEQKMFSTGNTGNKQSEVTIHGYREAGTDNSSINSSTAISNSNNNSNSNSNSAPVPTSDPIQIAMINDAAVPEVPDTLMLQKEMSSSSSDYGRAETYMAAKAQSPNRFRSYAVSLPNPVEAAAVMPVNLPDNYVLSVSSDTGPAVNFIFTETNTNQAVEITIQPYSVTSSDISLIAAGAQNEKQLEVIAEYEENQYLVKIKSSLSNDELLKLVATLKLGQSGQ